MMLFLARGLLLVVAIEIVIAGWVLATAVRHPPFPNADTGRLDPLTAADLGSLRTRLDPTQATSWQELAEAYLAYGCLPESEFCFRRAAEFPSNPSLGRVKFGWGTCLARLGRTQESTERLREAADLLRGPVALDCWIMIGRNALREENLVAAEDAFRRAGDRPPARYHLAKLLVRNGRIDEAQPLLDYLQSPMADNSHFNYLAANAAETQGQMAAAADYRERAERATLTFEMDAQREYLHSIAVQYGFLNRVTNCEQRKGPPEIAECLSMVVAQHPRRELYVMNLARAHLAARSDGAARKLLEEAIAADNISAEILECLGDVLHLQGHETEAKQQWLRAEAWGERATVFEKLADLLQKHGEEKTAQRYRGLQFEAEGVDAFRKNELAAAIKKLAAASEMNPDRARPWFYLGESYRAAGDKTRARQAYDRCLALDPQHDRVQTGLARLGS
jgi:Tfp pilus assembly protein PilF